MFTLLGLCIIKVHLFVIATSYQRCSPAILVINFAPFSPLMYIFFDSPSGRIFTSPNTAQAPPATFLPPLEGEEGLLQNLHELRLMSVRYPHLPYSPQYPLHTGPLFSCLHNNTIPIVHLKGSSLFTLLSLLGGGSSTTSSLRYSGLSQLDVLPMLLLHLCLPMPIM